MTLMAAAQRTKRDGSEVEAFLAEQPSQQRRLVLSVRRLIQRCAPGAAEAVRFHSLCYFSPSEPYGAIGGNICMIEADDRGVRLSFIHGASLADPHAILRGTAKAKRFVAIHSAADVRRSEVADLIRAAARVEPLPHRQERT